MKKSIALGNSTTTFLRNNGTWGSMPVHIYHSADLGFQASGTPPTGTIMGGQINQGVNQSMADDIDSGVLPVFIDDDYDFDYDSSGDVRIFYAVVGVDIDRDPTVQLIHFDNTSTVLSIYYNDTCDLTTWSGGKNTTYTFAGGTNSFTVTPSGGTAQTVTVTPSIDTSSLFPKTGGEITGDVTLLKGGTTPGDSYSLIFQRGTLTDNYNDWRIQDRGGFLYFDQRGVNSTSWANQVYFNTTGDVYATTFRGSGANLTSLNASNISSGTLNAARLPSGLEYTSNKVTSISSSSTDDEYASAKCTYDAIDAKENKGKITIGGTEYTVTRKALTITDGNGNTTTYYIADIT